MKKKRNRVPLYNGELEKAYQIKWRKIYLYLKNEDTPFDYLILQVLKDKLRELKREEVNSWWQSFTIHYIADKSLNKSDSDRYLWYIMHII